MFNSNNQAQFDWPGKKSTAQGTVEYLVILAVVVVISLVVVGIFTGMFSSSSQQVINSSSKLGSSTGGGISIVEAVLDPAGDSLVKLSNTSSDPITLTRISVGGVDNDFSEQVVGTDFKTFSLSNLVSGCTCSSGQKNVTCEYSITYTQNGIVKTSRINKTIECVIDSVPVASQPVVGLGSGTLVDPWVINSCKELQDMNQHVDGNYILGADINCYNDTRAGGVLYNGGAGFTPIGGTVDTNFLGSFNGNNKSISGLMINKAGDYVGLFGFITGNISNVRLIDVNVTGVSVVGSLVGSFRGSISNSYSTGTVTGSSNNVGGLVGFSRGIMSNSYFTGTVTGSSNNVGGLVGGQFSGLISNSYSTGNVNGYGDAVGGLLGYQYSGGSISNSYSTGIVSGSNYLGGLVGESNGLISHSYSTKTVTGSVDYVGGFVGLSRGTILNSYSTGNVIGSSNVGGFAGFSQLAINNSYSIGAVNGANYVGGLVGLAHGTISKSYSTGPVTSTSSVVGGLVGISNAAISNSYSTGVVTGPLSEGGLIGTQWINGTITNSYWDINRTGKTVCCGAGTCTNCVGKNDSNSDPNAFFPQVSLGLDYNVPMQHNIVPANDWTFGVDANWVKVDNNYPKLSWQ